MLVVGRSTDGDVIEIEGDRAVDDMTVHMVRGTLTGTVVVHLALRDGRRASIRADHLAPEGHALVARWAGVDLRGNHRPDHT